MNHFISMHQFDFKSILVTTRIYPYNQQSMGMLVSRQIYISFWALDHFTAEAHDCKRPLSELPIYTYMSLDTSGTKKA